MKKIYILSTAMLFGSMALGQKHQQAITKDFATTEVKAEKGINQKTAGYQVWADNFTTAGNWTIDNGSSSTGPDFGWSIGTTENSWYFSSGLTSTSGGNYARLSNGSASASTQALGVTYTMTTADSIDLTTSGTNVVLEFEQYGARFNDLQEIQISTNGTTFVPVGNNLNYAVLSTSGGSAYANPTLKSINLSSYLTGATKVWIRFSWTTNFPGSATNPNVWITYGWFIDDVTLTTSSDNDIQTTSNYYETFNVKYTKIPVSQIAPIDFSAVVNNNGLNAISGAKYNVTVNPGAVAVASSPMTLSIGATGDTLTTASFTPPGLGTYTVTGNVVHDSIDDVPSNNTIASNTFEVTPFIYALDNGVASGYTADSDLSTIFEAGNVFDIVSPVDVWGVFARIATGTPSGTANGVNVTAQLRKYNATTDDYDIVAASNAVQVSASMVNVESFFKFDFPYTMEAGESYLATLISFDEGLRISNAGTSLIGNSLIQYSDDPATWFYQTNTPWVRLNFDPSLGLEETNGGLTLSNVYPNPTSGNSTVSFSLENAQNVSVTVLNVAGQVVYTNNMGTVQSGAHSVEINSKEFNAGVYMVNITSNDGVVTKKLIKK